MSPTSYQAAPPRASRLKKIFGRWRRVNLLVKSGEWGVGSELAAGSWRLSPTPHSSLAFCRVRWADQVQQLLVPAHHPDILPGQLLLERPIGVETPAIPAERIDPPGKRIDLLLKPRLAIPLDQQVPRAELPALHGEPHHREHRDAEEDSPDHWKSRSLAARGMTPLETIQRAAGE